MTTTTRETTTNKPHDKEEKTGKQPPAELIEQLLNKDFAQTILNEPAATVALKINELKQKAETERKTQ